MEKSHLSLVVMEREIHFNSNHNGLLFSDGGTVQSGNVSVMPDANAMFEDVTGLEFLNFISDLKTFLGKKL